MMFTWELEIYLIKSLTIKVFDIIFLLFYFVMAIKQPTTVVSIPFLTEYNSVLLLFTIQNMNKENAFIKIEGNYILEIRIFLKSHVSTSLLKYTNKNIEAIIE